MVMIGAGCADNTPAIYSARAGLNPLVLEDSYAGEVAGARLRNVTTGRTWSESANGIFVAIGHVPNTKPLIGELQLDEEGYVVSRGGASVFHAGDVQGRRYRQAITASGAGGMAAMEAGRDLESLEHSTHANSIMREVAR
jgi:thioredoxin reductase (NADPH)